MRLGTSTLPPAAPPGPEMLLRIDVPTRAALLSDLALRLGRGEGFAVATLNLDHVVKLGRDAQFRTAYAAQTHVVADGHPLVWLSWLSGRRAVRLVPGADLIGPVAALAAQQGVAVALIGSTAPVLAQAARRLMADHPGLRVAACIAPPMDFDPDGAAADALLDRVAASGARLCLVALGAPKQERLAARGRALHPELGFLSIGAGLDFLAGRQRRAPVWLRRLALEWLWRLLSDPRRLARRYGDCLRVLPALLRAAVLLRWRG